MVVSHAYVSPYIAGVPPIVSYCAVCGRGRTVYYAPSRIDDCDVSASAHCTMGDATSHGIIEVVLTCCSCLTLLGPGSADQAEFGVHNFP